MECVLHAFKVDATHWAIIEKHVIGDGLVRVIAISNIVYEPMRRSCELGKYPFKPD